MKQLLSVFNAVVLLFCMSVQNSLLAVTENMRRRSLMLKGEDKKIKTRQDLN